MQFTYPWLDQAYDFECFPNWGSKWMADLVLAGVTYPHLDFVDDVRVVLDVGANIGATATYFARSYPEATVYALEPGSDPYALLVQNAERLPNVVTFNLGLDAEDRQAELFKGTLDSVLASIHATENNTDDSEVITLRSARGWVEEQGLERIDVLKVDTEGCEVQILGDLKHRLDEIKIIYLEYHSEADRREIDAILGPTHALFFGRLLGVSGEFVYLAHDLVPAPGEFDVAPLFKNLVPG